MPLIWRVAASRCEPAKIAAGAGGGSPPRYLRAASGARLPLPVDNLVTLVKPEAEFVSCMAGTCAAWEVVLFIWKGKFREAFPTTRTRAAVGGRPLRCLLVSIGARTSAGVSSLSPSSALDRRRCCDPPFLFREPRKEIPARDEPSGKDGPVVRTLPSKGLADHFLLTFQRRTS